MSDPLPPPEGSRRGHPWGLFALGWIVMTVAGLGWAIYHELTARLHIPVTTVASSDAVVIYHETGGHLRSGAWTRVGLRARTPVTLPPGPLAPELRLLDAEGRLVYTAVWPRRALPPDRPADFDFTVVAGEEVRRLSLALLADDGQRVALGEVDPPWRVVPLRRFWVLTTGRQRPDWPDATVTPLPGGRPPTAPRFYEGVDAVALAGAWPRGENDPALATADERRWTALVDWIGGGGTALAGSPEAVRRLNALARARGWPWREAEAAAGEIRLGSGRIVPFDAAEADATDGDGGRMSPDWVAWRRVAPRLPPPADRDLRLAREVYEKLEGDQPEVVWPASPRLATRGVWAWAALWLTAAGGTAAGWRRRRRGSRPENPDGPEPRSGQPTEGQRSRGNPSPADNRLPRGGRLPGNVATGIVAGSGVTVALLFAVWAPEPSPAVSLAFSVSAADAPAADPVSGDDVSRGKARVFRMATAFGRPERPGVEWAADDGASARLTLPARPAEDFALATDAAPEWLEAGWVWKWRAYDERELRNAHIVYDARDGHDRARLRLHGRVGSGGPGRRGVPALWTAEGSAPAKGTGFFPEKDEEAARRWTRALGTTR